MFKVGDKVKMRNGKEARILCTDLKNPNGPIVAAFFVGNFEVARNFTADGYYYSSDSETQYDLIKEPEYQWQWLYLCGDGFYETTGYFETKELMLERYGKDTKILYRIEESKREVEYD